MNEPVASEYQRGNAEKQALDIAVAYGLGLVALTGGTAAALLLATANLSFKPMYHHNRKGLGNKLFSLWKLRTMDDEGNLLKLAYGIRALGLDETPQFINILLGQMSAVGYRPLLVEDENYAYRRLKAHFTASSPFYPDRWLSLRRQTRPGITGPSQILPLHPDAGGLNHLMGVVAAECNFMESGNLITDMSIMAKTPFAIMRGYNPTVSRVDNAAGA